MIIVSRYQASRIETIGMQGGLPLPPTDTYKTFKAADVRNAGDARRRPLRNQRWDDICVFRHSL